MSQIDKSEGRLHIGTKQIKAWPMSRWQYNQYRGWEVPADENPTDAGYLVEYLDGGESNHENHDGYISWSPKAVFENAYQDAKQGMSFSHALQFLQNGQAVARQGWNGKDMFIYFVPENAYESQTLIAKHYFKEGKVPYGAYIAMKTAQGNVVPWLCSQTDMNSDDWVVL